MHIYPNFATSERADLKNMNTIVSLRSKQMPMSSHIKIDGFFSEKKIYHQFCECQLDPDIVHCTMRLSFLNSGALQLILKVFLLELRY